MTRLNLLCGSFLQMCRVGEYIVMLRSSCYCRVCGRMWSSSGVTAFSYKRRVRSFFICRFLPYLSFAYTNMHIKRKTRIRWRSPEENAGAISARPSRPSKRRACDNRVVVRTARITVQLNSLVRVGIGAQRLRRASFRVKPAGEDTYAGVSRARESIFAVGTSLQVARGDARDRLACSGSVTEGTPGSPRAPLALRAALPLAPGLRCIALHRVAVHGVLVWAKGHRSQTHRGGSQRWERAARSIKRGSAKRESARRAKDPLNFDPSKALRIRRRVSTRTSSLAFLKRLATDREF